MFTTNSRRKLPHRWANIPFHGNFSAKEYIRNKPNPWGIKVYLLCGASGIVYDLLMYQGQRTALKDYIKKQFGESAGTVFQLAQRIPHGKNYKIYYDSYFTTVLLLQKLAEFGIYCTGTIRQNQIGKTPLLSEKFETKGTWSCFRSSLLRW